MNTNQFSDLRGCNISNVTSIAELRSEVARLLDHAWVDHVNTLGYRGEWDVLPLRCAAHYANAHPILQGFSIADGEEWINLPLLLQFPHLLELINALQCPVKSARLMRLKAGAHILPHRDKFVSMEYGEARLHLPIFSHDDVQFLIEDERLDMRAGELWYINVNKEHQVINSGREDRINLVIDCVANDWLAEKIALGVEAQASLSTS